MISLPTIIVLDSSTIGDASRDYWSRDGFIREKARKFVAELKDRCVFVAFTATHVAELLRHGNESIVRDRLSFLRRLPFVAWLRPYDRIWFPGSIIDLLARELHTVVYESASDWKAIVQKVRPDLWETGTGAELFVEDEYFWSRIRQEVGRDPQHEKVIASISRTRPFGNKPMKVRDALRLPHRPKEDWPSYSKILAEKMQLELDQHGDKKLKSSCGISNAFAEDTLGDMLAVDASCADWLSGICIWMGIPLEMIGPEMTTDQIGALAIYCNKLNLVSRQLVPPTNICAKDVPPGTLPSYVLESRLAALQETAERVSGSDIGDKQIAPLALYADAIELDKRTNDYMHRICSTDRHLSGLVGKHFGSPDYSGIWGILDQQ